MMFHKVGHTFKANLGTRRPSIARSFHDDGVFATVQILYVLENIDYTPAPALEVYVERVLIVLKMADAEAIMVPYSLKY